MANNRMYLRCRFCGETIKIASCCLDPYGVTRDNLSEDLDNFFEEHYYCEKERVKNGDGYDLKEYPLPEFPKLENAFDIVYEFKEE